jgi:hypothetical protein
MAGKALQEALASNPFLNAEAAPLKATALATTLLVFKHIATVAVQVGCVCSCVCECACLGWFRSIDQSLNPSPVLQPRVCVNLLLPPLFPPQSPLIDE